MIDGIDIDKILISNSSMKWISLGQLYKKKNVSKIGLGQLYKNFFFKNQSGTTL